MMMQRSLREKIEFEGVGIHTGERAKLILHPEEENSGITFYRNGYRIPLSPDSVVNTFHSTDLGLNGTVVKTVEHLLATFHLLGITNLTVEVVGGCEIPIMDGSGYPFYRGLKDRVIVQSEKIEPFCVEEEITVRRGESFVRAEPAQSLEVTYEGVFREPFGRRSFTFRGNVKDIILARTFCFDHEIELIRKRGLGRGGSLENTLVIGSRKAYNRGGFRYEDEPVRHKILDLIGDLFLLGVPVLGRFFSYRGGHTTNVELIRILHRRFASVS